MRGNVVLLSRGFSKELNEWVFGELVSEHVIESGDVRYDVVEGTVGHFTGMLDVEFRNLFSGDYVFLAFDEIEGFEVQSVLGVVSLAGELVYEEGRVYFRDMSAIANVGVLDLWELFNRLIELGKEYKLSFNSIFYETSRDKYVIYLGNERKRFEIPYFEYTSSNLYRLIEDYVRGLGKEIGSDSICVYSSSFGFCDVDTLDGGSVGVDVRVTFEEFRLDGSKSEDALYRERRFEKLIEKLGDRETALEASLMEDTATYVGMLGFRDYVNRLRT